MDARTGACLPPGVRRPNPRQAGAGGERMAASNCGICHGCEIPCALSHGMKPACATGGVSRPRMRAT
eukprot:349770-Chlamydomonas_euryale.AAC.6